MMSKLRFLLRNLRHYRWLHLATLLAVAIASAALTGALVVGDSVRGSLRQIIIERLGPIDLLLATDRFFDPKLADSLKDDVNVELAAAIILPEITIEVQNQGRRVKGVFLSAWPRESSLSRIQPVAEDEITINAALAAELDVQVGDALVIRLPESNQVPADSPLGRKDGRVRSRAGLRIREILPNNGAGQLSLSLNQQTPRNAFVNLRTLQRSVGVNGVNAILAKRVEVPDESQSSKSHSLDDTALAHALTKKLRPKLSDLGIKATVVTGQYQSENAPNIAWRYLQFSTDRMILQDAIQVEMASALASKDASTVFTYLANTIRLAGNSEGIPYSTISAIDDALLNQLSPTAAGLKRGEIALNSWAADNLGANIGDTIEISYFDPETTHGNAIERSRKFALKYIIPIVEPDEPFSRRQSATFTIRPTRGNDPALTPVVEGVTDQDSIDDWDPPFPFDQRRVRDEDDLYWDYYRTTPKAFVSLADGKEMWKSRFGGATSVRVPLAVDDDEAAVKALETEVESALQPVKSELGFRFIPIKQKSLTAAAGTTPFEGLFIGFNFFLITAALMLIAILIQLAMQMRAKDLGLLKSVGWQDRSVRQTLGWETLIVVILGAIVGAAGGILFARLTLHALRTWWVEAIATPFVHLHLKLPTLGIGILSSAILAWFTIRRTFKRLTQLPATRLLRGYLEAGPAQSRRGPWLRWLSLGLLLLAAAIAIFGLGLSGMGQAGAFFGSGAMTLTALLIYLREWLRSPTHLSGAPSVSTFRHFSLALLRRNPKRSALTAGLVATASFLLVAMAAFRLAPTTSGTGGFQLIGQSDRPIFLDLTDPKVLNEETGLENGQVIGLRLRPGDDASCRNLFQISEPRVIGITPQFIGFVGEQTTSFEFGSVGQDEAGNMPLNPWTLLNAKSDGAIPVILDQNTALYSLHLRGKVGEEFEMDYGRPLRFRIVGLLSNSLLQGALMISETALLEHFPETAGYRLFLGRSSQAEQQMLANALEKRFGDEGLDMQDTTAALSDLLAVQNTYLSTFQSLGLLGLLLGTLGLAFVQLRSVLERRGELALMQTIGFSRSRLGQMVLTETMIVVVLGVAIGLLAASVTVIPHAIFGTAQLPYKFLAGMLVLILLCGIVASLGALAAVRRMPVLTVLREQL